MSIKELIKFLKFRKSDIVIDVDCLVEVYDPTYGLQEPRTKTISVIDFDALMQAIDDFSEQF